jgi:hypothetical protein
LRETMGEEYGEVSRGIKACQRFCNELKTDEIQFLTFRLQHAAPTL